MVCLLASLALAQAGSPVYAVQDFEDRWGGRYGHAAAEAMARRFQESGTPVIGPAEFAQKVSALGLQAPLKVLYNLGRVGKDLGVPLVVRGDVVEYQVDSVGAGWQGYVVLNVVAYDPVNLLPVKGAIELGRSVVRAKASDESLLQEALENAAMIVERTMRARRNTATVLNAEGTTRLINQGSQGGFRAGQLVIVRRGSETLGTARIGIVEPDQASLVETPAGITPGDRVTAVYVTPTLPPPGTKIVRGPYILRDAKRGAF